MNLEDILNASRVFVDANIILYALDHKSPSCRRFLERCEGGVVDGVITTVTLAEVTHRRMVEEARSNGLAGFEPGPGPCPPTRAHPAASHLRGRRPRPPGGGTER